MVENRADLDNLRVRLNALKEIAIEKTALVEAQLAAAQEAAAEARRRAAEAERRREEAAYLAQFGQLPPDTSEQEQQPDTGNVPIAVLPEPAEDTTAGDDGYSEPLNVAPSTSGNAPVAEVEPEPETETETPRDLDDIREELKRRNSE